MKLYSCQNIERKNIFLAMSHTLLGQNFVDKQEDVRLFTNHCIMKDASLFHLKKVYASEINVFCLKTFQSNIYVVLMLCLK